MNVSLVGKGNVESFLNEIKSQLRNLIAYSKLNFADCYAWLNHEFEIRSTQNFIMTTSKANKPTKGLLCLVEILIVHLISSSFKFSNVAALSAFEVCRIIFLTIT